MPALLSFLLTLTYIFAYGDAFSGQPKSDSEQEYGGTCKINPGSPSWPSSETWTRFNQSTGGKLLRTAAPGAVCHPGQPAYNFEQCAIVTPGWRTYDFHRNDPVSNLWQQFNNDTCLPDPTSPCSPDGYPAYVVNATTAHDVKLALDFARTHGIRVTVKSTGHDYQGRSQAPGALSIWVRHLEGLKTQTSFRPRGCKFTIESPAVTVGGGSAVGDIYDELGKINQTIVAASSRSVSVGGYLTGGGHSILSPRYGLGSDSVLEMEVVTPMGDIVVANECQNQDLFWAMRGGGGSTFGVMTSVTLATYPSPQMIELDLALFTADPDATYTWDMVGYVLSQYPYLDSKGVSGYSIITRNFSFPGIPVTGAGLGGSFIMLDTQDINDTLSIWSPILDHINKTWPSVVPVLTPQTYSSFQGWFSVHFDQGTAGHDLWVGSHLLSAESFTRNTAAATEAFRNFGGTAYLVAGQGVNKAKPRGGSSAVNPSWRKALVHATTSLSFPPLNRTAKIETLTKVNAQTEGVRRLEPDMGSYLNENNPAEPDWQRSFWGDNYDRLLRIKRAVDPFDVLWCHPCVGNERWREVGYQLCRVD
ncbi:FAD-binding domain-containing protein [Hypoxylon sp. FL1857]|nr:FAD-binding domain-containing protein [Hypoxylon sp. FL1857]